MDAAAPHPAVRHAASRWAYVIPMAALFMLMGAFMAFGPLGFVVMAGAVALYYGIPQRLLQARRNRFRHQP